MIYLQTKNIRKNVQHPKYKNRLILIRLKRNCEFIHICKGHSNWKTLFVCFDTQLPEKKVDEKNVYLT